MGVTRLAYWTQDLSPLLCSTDQNRSVSWNRLLGWLSRIVKRLLYLMSASRKQRSSLIGQCLFRAFESWSCCVRTENARRAWIFRPPTLLSAYAIFVRGVRGYFDKYIACSYSMRDVCERFFSTTDWDIAVTTETFLRE